MTEMRTPSKSDPTAVMRAIADWQRGWVERLTADLQEWMTLWMQATQMASTAQSDSAQDDAASSDSPDGKATKAKRQSAASASKSEHATPV